MDEESSDSKKIKTDEITTQISESESVISPKEISIKKNVCKLILTKNLRPRHAIHTPHVNSYIHATP